MINKEMLDIAILLTILESQEFIDLVIEMDKKGYEFKGITIEKETRKRTKKENK